VTKGFRITGYIKPVKHHPKINSSQRL